MKFIKGLGFAKFKVLMQRHNDPTRAQHYGTPDLFLWAIKKGTGKIGYIRFVEVKKPNEPLSQGQKDELCFLKCNLHLKARLFRLKEAK
ncbi:VRR-NUC domain-containing protein [Paracoccaceae bacterium]|nr:VRR-NUC domain-containing protein [Paracoccaceae bacterium]